MRRKFSEARAFGSQRGSVTILALIGILLLAVIAYQYTASYQSIRRTQERINFYNTIAQIQLNIRGLVNDSGSWTTAIGDGIRNSSMACLRAQACVSSIPPTAFALWPAGAVSYGTGQAFYDGTDPSAGFNFDGTRCAGFSMTGNANCPIHLNLQWSTTGCAPAPCQAPVTVHADVVYRPGGSSDPGSFNETNFALNFQQSLATATGSCTGAAPATEIAACRSSTYNDQLVCTSSGWRCGRIFY